MLSLFEEYKSNNMIAEALMVGHNLFNKHPGNEEVFTAYFSFLCSLAETMPSFADKMNFAEQADVALAFYTENAALTKASVEAIGRDKSRLVAIYESLDATKAEKVAAEQAAVEQHNSECLKKLYALKDALQGAKTQSEFDNLLLQVGKLDEDIDKAAFTEEQDSIYQSLTKEHTDLISAKMRQLEHAANVAYNKKAADAFASAFQSFRKDESKYKNQTQLFALASSTLFAYDASRLFNETLIYYNHVYSYIFSKLDDDGKLALTRYSIECERKLR